MSDERDTVPAVEAAGDGAANLFAVLAARPEVVEHAHAMTLPRSPRSDRRAHNGADHGS